MNQNILFPGAFPSKGKVSFNPKMNEETKTKIQLKTLVIYNFKAEPKLRRL